MSGIVKTKSGRIAVAGVSSALAAVLLMLNNLIPTGTVGLTAAAAVVVFFIEEEFGIKLAIGVYVVTSVLAFILVPANPNVFWMYAVMLGLYSVIKRPTDCLRSRFMRIVIKGAFAIVSFVVYCVAVTFIAGLTEVVEMLAEKEIILITTVVLYFVAFVLYDFCLTRLAWLYHNKFRRRLFGNSSM